MKVSDYVIQFLAEKNIDKVFSYIGKNAHLCDSIDKHDKVENVFTIHEQGAGFSANAYARVTGKTGVATVTSGPGATNLVTPIADCYFDSVPTLFIVGDVPPAECKGERGVRQYGFQETDVVKLCGSITKYATQVDDLSNLRYELEKAYFYSQEGRKGPVVFSLPENLQFRTDFDPKKQHSFIDSVEYKEIIKKSPVLGDISSEIAEVAAALNLSKRPVILIGGGIRLADAINELKFLLNKTKIPVVYSLMGKDAISDEYDHNIGLLGNFGTRHANLTIANADVLLVLGSRLDNLQTGRRIETFARDAKIIQVDIDKNELGIRVKTDLIVKADLKVFLQQLNNERFDLDIIDWQNKTTAYKTSYPVSQNFDGSNRVGNKLIEEISDYLNDDDCICVDVGEHQMLVAQSLKTKDQQRVLFSGGFGAMGFALPAAIGAALATGKRAIVISGDGGIQMNIQELEIIKRRKLPIKIFVINNGSLHMVKLRQDTYLEGNSVGSISDYSVPRLSKIAKAYGIKGYKASKPEKILKNIKKILSSQKPELFEIQIQADSTTVEPRLDFNRPFEEMRPYLSKHELEEQMLIKLVE